MAAIVLQPLQPELTNYPRAAPRDELGRIKLADKRDGLSGNQRHMHVGPVFTGRVVNNRPWESYIREQIPRAVIRSPRSRKSDERHEWAMGYAVRPLAASYGQSTESHCPGRNYRRLREPGDTR